MTISFLATYFLNPCSVVYFSLISPSYIKRKIANVNTWIATFNVHLNTYLRLFFLFFYLRKKMKVGLSVLGTAKTESGYHTRCKSLFCNDWRMRQIDCVNEPTGKQFSIYGRRKFNLWPNHTCQTRVQNTQSILGEFLLVGYWRFKKESICSSLSGNLTTCYLIIPTFWEHLIVC